MPSSRSDFRDDASRECLRLLSNSTLDSALSSPGSLCIPVSPSLKLPLYRLAVVPWLGIAPSIVLIVFAPVYTLLILTPWVDASLRTILLCVGSLVAGIALLLVSSKLSDANGRAIFASTLGARLPELQQRLTERWTFCIEDPATYTKLKLISEDYATGGPDRLLPGLLLDGIRYRYVIRPADVTEVISDRDYLVITYLVGGTPLKLALNVLTDDCDPSGRKRALQIVRELLSTSQTPVTG